MEAVQPFSIKLFNWKPYNRSFYFLSSYLVGSRTIIDSQAIELEAVQPFLFISSYLLGSRTTIKKSSYLVGSRINTLTQAIELEAVQPLICLQLFIEIKDDLIETETRQSSMKYCAELNATAAAVAISPRSSGRTGTAVRDAPVCALPRTASSSTASLWRAGERAPVRGEASPVVGTA